MFDDCHVAIGSWSVVGWPAAVIGGALAFLALVGFGTIVVAIARLVL